MSKPRLLIFASGDKSGGGSGFKNLAMHAKAGNVHADIIGVVSNHLNGGVRQKAEDLGINFIHFPKPWDTDSYFRILSYFAEKPEFVAMSGWLKIVPFEDFGAQQHFWQSRWFNIHPGPAHRDASDMHFGGHGYWGHHVHEAVHKAYNEGLIKYSHVTMHFATPKPDDGPVFLRIPVPLYQDDTPDTIGERVNKAEHVWQPWATDLVCRGLISWDGKNHDSLSVPAWYTHVQAPIK